MFTVGLLRVPVPLHSPMYCLRSFCICFYFGSDLKTEGESGGFLLLYMTFEQHLKTNLTQPIFFGTQQKFRCPLYKMSDRWGLKNLGRRIRSATTMRKSEPPPMAVSSPSGGVRPSSGKAIGNPTSMARKNDINALMFVPF